MFKPVIILVIFFIYTILYKTYLIFQGEAITYVFNPLVWIVFATICHFSLRNNHRKEIRRSIDIIPIVTTLSLIYIIFYYAFGIVSGYTNNPYATTISGIIVNFFSIGLVVGLREYLRYLFININLRRYKKIYYILLFIIFFATEINILNIINTSDIINLWAKELIIPFLFTLLMMYLSYVGDYKAPIIARLILLLPALIFNVVPDYKWYVIMLFSIVYCLAIYLGSQYVISRHQRDLPARLTDNINLRGWIMTSIISFSLMAFLAGFLPLKPVVVLTASMKPLINPGDVVIIKKCRIENIKTGDIIAYQLEDYMIIHRVIALSYSLDKTIMITKGDANKKQDPNPVTKEQVMGCLEYHVPYIGYPSFYIRNLINNSNEVKIEQGG